MKGFIALGIFGLSACSFGSIVLSESFQGLVDSSGTESVKSLMDAGWVFDNESSPVGTQKLGWYGSDQFANSSYANIANPDGNPNDSFIAADFNATGTNADGSGGNANALLETPEINLGTGYTLTFQTISASSASMPYPDALNVLLSTSGASTSLSAFSTTILQINSGLSPTGYPEVWTTYTITLPGGIQPGTMGRIALDYAVPDSGPNGVNGDFIGVANMVLTTPEPTPFAALGLGALFLVRRRRRK